MNRDEVTEVLKGKDKTFICDVIVRLIEGGSISITDFNECYIRTLKKDIEKKDTIIREADNCIFNSLAYDSMNKVDSSNVILDKVRWIYRNSNTNKEKLCEIFNYDPDKDKILDKDDKNGYSKFIGSAVCRECSSMQENIEFIPDKKIDGYMYFVGICKDCGAKLWIKI